jgi:hypothetical protein
MVAAEFSRCSSFCHSHRQVVVVIVWTISPFFVRRDNEGMVMGSTYIAIPSRFSRSKASHIMKGW